MGLPRVLKNYNLFNDGESYMGQVEEVTLPKLARKTEDYRGAGMSGTVKLDFGQEAIEIEWKAAGFMAGVFRQYGLLNISGAQLRFAGAYQSDDSVVPDAVEIVVRGRHTEIDPGKAKAGDKTEFAVKTACSYYKLVVNGETLIEIDPLNGIEKVGGSDRNILIRAIIGVF